MHVRRAVQDMSTVAGDRPGIVAVRLPSMPGLLAVLIAIAIAMAAFLYGDQPFTGDSQGYYDFGRLIANVGLRAFASDFRTYGYPLVLAGIMAVVGQDVGDVWRATFMVQFGLLVGVTWICARRVAGALGVEGVGAVVFAVTVANPFVLVLAGLVLTDLMAAMLLYLALVLALPQHRPEPRARVALLVACALFCAGFSVMLRPSNLLAVLMIVAVWTARAVLYRDLPWFALPAALLALCLPFVPQAMSNQRAYSVASPLVTSSVYQENMIAGPMYIRSVTLALPGVPSMVHYENPLRPPPGLTLAEVIREYPVRYFASYGLHAFALVDQDLPFTYVRDVKPWYRWPLSILNYVFLLGAFAGLVLGLRGRALQPADQLLRQRFTMLACALTGAALVAIYLPVVVESRYGMPLYLLLAPSFALAAVWVYAALPTAGAWRLSLGTLAVAAWVGCMATASVWVEHQAPLLVALRGGDVATPATANQPASQVSQPAVVPAAPPQPTPEIPSARYVADLPRELSISTRTEFDVTVINTGRETWNVDGPYPVNVAVRFIAQRTELHDQVKGVMRDSRSVKLPGDVAPGASATVRLRTVSPPMPGRYTLLVHVTRLGVPDSRTTLTRVVSVVD